jgi:ABC-2 type transport system permease protein
MVARPLLTYGTIGADFWFAVFSALTILVVFIPLNLNAYKRNV